MITTKTTLTEKIKEANNSEIFKIVIKETPISCSVTTHASRRNTSMKADCFVARIEEIVKAYEPHQHRLEGAFDVEKNKIYDTRPIVEALKEVNATNAIDHQHEIIDLTITLGVLVECILEYNRVRAMTSIINKLIRDTKALTSNYGIHGHFYPAAPAMRRRVSDYIDSVRDEINNEKLVLTTREALRKVALTDIYKAFYIQYREHYNCIVNNNARAASKHLVTDISRANGIAVDMADNLWIAIANYRKAGIEESRLDSVIKFTKSIDNLTLILNTVITKANSMTRDFLIEVMYCSAMANLVLHAVVSNCCEIKESELMDSIQAACDIKGMTKSSMKFNVLSSEIHNDVAAFEKKTTARVREPIVTPAPTSIDQARNDVCLFISKMHSMSKFTQAITNTYIAHFSRHNGGDDKFSTLILTAAGLYNNAYVNYAANHDIRDSDLPLFNEVQNFCNVVILGADVIRANSLAENARIIGPLAIVTTFAAIKFDNDLVKMLAKLFSSDGKQTNPLVFNSIIRVTGLDDEEQYAARADEKPSIPVMIGTQRPSPFYLDRDIVVVKEKATRLLMTVIAGLGGGSSLDDRLYNGLRVIDSLHYSANETVRDLTIDALDKFAEVRDLISKVRDDAPDISKYHARGNLVKYFRGTYTGVSSDKAIAFVNEVGYLLD